MLHIIRFLWRSVAGGLCIRGTASISQFTPHDPTQHISQGHAGTPRVVVGLQIAPALRIGAKEDAQAQDRAGVNEGNFSGHSVALV